MIENYDLLMSHYHKKMDDVLSAQDEWHKRRYNGIGGSEMAAVLGISKYQSAYDLWLVYNNRFLYECSINHQYYGCYDDCNVRTKCYCIVYLVQRCEKRP